MPKTYCVVGHDARQQAAARVLRRAGYGVTAADNAADLGATIVYRGPDELPVTGRPLAIKRIIANLVDNARRHGERILRMRMNG